MGSEKIKELISYIEKTKAIDFKIERSDLTKETDYIKNSYFKLLAVLLVQGTEIQSGQKNLYERLIAGSNCDYQMHDYICQALDIEIKEYVEFMDQCRELPIRFSFVLDVLLLTIINERENEQIKLASNYIEALRIQDNTLKYLCKLTKAILEQDVEQYMSCEAIRPNDIPERFGINYIAMDLRPGIINYDLETMLYAPSLTDVSDALLEELEKSESPIIHLKNIYVKPYQHKFIFSGLQTLIFENCIFESNEAITINESNKVVISGCTFREFSFRVFCLDNVSKMIIENSKFEHCILSCNERYSDEISNSYCIAYSKDERTAIYLENCQFNTCRVENRAYGSAKNILFNSVCQVKNSKIENCLGYSELSDGKGNAMRSPLFPETSVNIGCEINKSGLFS